MAELGAQMRELLGRVVTLLYQPCVLLRHLVHLCHGLIDLLDTAALFDGGCRDVLHQRAELLNVCHYTVDHFTGVFDLAAAFDHLSIRVFDQTFDLLGSRRRSASQLANLVGHHRKTTPLLPPRGLLLQKR